jgi:hypothetical protein
MKEKSKRMIVAGISGCIGGGLGAVSGSNSLLVVAVVSAVAALIAAWIINGMIR